MKKGDIVYSKIHKKKGKITKKYKNGWWFTTIAPYPICEIDLIKPKG